MRYVLWILLLFSPLTFADIYWTAINKPAQYSSGEAACKSLTTTMTFTHFVLLGNNPVSQKANCYYKRSDGATWFDPGSLYVTRFGECSAGTVYNPYSGACEGDPCEPTIGAIVYHKFAFLIIGSDSNPSADPPITVCKNNCQYSHTYDGYTINSKRDFTPPDQILGSFKYKGNGISCTASASDPSVFDQPPAKEPVDTPAEYTHDNNCDSNWTTNPDGTLSRSCTSSKEFKEPGTIDCKGGWSAAHCKAGNPAPEYKKTETTETTTKTDKPDGSKTTETTTTTDTTTCKGLKPCETTSKTEGKKDDINPDGSPGDSKETCTGTGCNPDKKDDDGKDDEEKEEEKDERTANAGTCDGSFSCEGDAIDCEVLKKQKEQLCFAEEQADFEAKKSDIEGLFEGDKFKVDEGSGEIEAPSFINKGTRFLPSTCPADQSFSLTTGGGRSFALSFEPLCRAASDLSGLFVAITGIFCALYVGRSVGGQ